MEATNVPWQMVRKTVTMKIILLGTILIVVWVLWMPFTSMLVDTDSNLAIRNLSEKKILQVNDTILDHPHDVNTELSVPAYKEELRTTINENVQKCSKKFDVSFLKVHKAGSTTLMNIFLRFAIEHRLNIVLPSRSSGYGFNYLGYGKTVSKKKIVPLPANESYNILCNHVVYNKTVFRSIMPPDTVYVGIIREPVSHFTSAATYYGFYKTLLNLFAGKVLSRKVLSEFLKNPAQAKLQTFFIYNRMSFDFGMLKEKFHDNRYVDDYIKELDRDYELVLIMEHFQESLVLMKRVLCWETKDILYVPLNTRKNKTEIDLDENDIANLRQWNSADFNLYGHFYKVFQAKVESLGDDFREEVDAFKAIQERVKHFCTITVLKQTGMSSLTVSKNRWCESFTVTDKDCKLMTESEIPMMKRLIENAWSRYNESMRNA